MAVGCSSNTAQKNNKEQSEPQVFTKQMQDSISSAGALEKLKRGNERFVSGDLKYKNYRQQFEGTAEGQYPHSTVYACIDSRSAAEQFFDVGIGEIFKVRIAGNVISDDVLGSMEFATKVAGSKVLSVVGHTNCGAVKGAIDNAELGHLTGLVEKIKPAMKQVSDTLQPRTSKNKAFVNAVTEVHIKNVLDQIRERSDVIREQVEAGTLKLVGGIYDLKTGKVTFFEK
jgi:carbonic anhydrase